MSLKSVCCFCSHCGCMDCDPLEMKLCLHKTPFVTACVCRQFENMKRVSSRNYLFSFLGPEDAKLTPKTAKIRKKQILYNRNIVFFCFPTMFLGLKTPLEWWRDPSAGLWPLLLGTAIRWGSSFNLLESLFRHHFCCLSWLLREHSESF